MAIVSLIFGSIIGFFAAVFGWAVLDFSLLPACGLYFATSLCLASVLIAGNMIREMTKFDTNGPQIPAELARGRG
ncbi:hypothetical protein [Puniceibacterium sp. IMCC21224]|uniref:hypothetical protein n=1 Tax=Puniceibacterium sp. IMCC21224 TaxID=1618204 RepID=UPI00064DDDC5|nr:hypothetical protein [Puniceibacterium sp. IMCC21224]KMK65705.1 hypothetical protein IMCC21224_11539 [Puniceibacterium sp. IMCC21224]